MSCGTGFVKTASRVARCRLFMADDTKSDIICQDCTHYASTRDPQILSGTRGLAFIRGQWVEVDAEQLRRTLERFNETERLASERGITFAEATRLLSGADVAGEHNAATA